MLSAESSVGDFAIEAVSVMDRVATRMESEADYTMRIDRRISGRSTASDAITAAARQVSKSVGAAAIVTFTTSGATALRAARERPDVPILALTPRVSMARRLCLAWGIHAVKTRDIETFEEMVGKSKRMALRQNMAKAGDRLVVTAGVPFGTAGATNVLHIALVSGRELDGHEDTPGN